MSGTGLAYYLPKGWLKLVTADKATITYVGPLTFEKSNFTTNFASDLSQPLSPMSKYLMSQLTEEEKKALNERKSDEIPQKLVDGLNRILTNSFLYDSERVPSKALSPLSQLLLDQQPKGDQRLLLNRFVLQDVYAGQDFINASRTIRTNVAPISAGVDVTVAADRDWRYLLKMKPSVMANDTFQLRVTNGLLQSISVTNDDQTMGVLSNLLVTAIEAAKAAGMVSFAPEQGNFVDIASFTRTNTVLVDPFEAAMTNGGKLVLNSVEFDLRDFIGDASNYSKMGDTKPESLKEVAGIFYRPLDAYKIGWSSPGIGSAQAIIRVPNKAFVFKLTIDRRLFVRQTTTFEFQDGVPINVTRSKPSEVAAFMSLPVAIAQTFTAPLTNFLPVKVGGGGSQTSSPTVSVTNFVQINQQSNSVQQLNQPIATNAPSSKP